MENVRTIRQVRKTVRPSARCGRSSAKPVKERTARTDRNGFLTHRFQPFWGFNGHQKRAETEFFRSLTNICAYYDFVMPDVNTLPFPQNIYKAWEITAQRINAVDKQLDCIILRDKQHTSTLATIRQLDTGRTLYYIAVRPVWRWVQSATCQDLAELVLTVFAYLHQVAEVPFYSHGYIGSQYEMIGDWIRDGQGGDSAENGEGNEQLDEIYVLKNAGLHLYKQINDPHRLQQMESVITAYSYAENRNNDWAILAIEFLQLYRAYPNRSFFDNIRPDLYYPEIEERIRAEEYISFYWSDNDCLTETLFENINCSFQEMGVTDEPIMVERFDTLDEKKTDNFGFESRLLGLINRLAQLLNDNDDEEHM